MGKDSPRDELTGQIQIRIRPDGRVYFDGLSAEILEVAASLSPMEAALKQRLALMQEVKAQSQPPQQETECHDGDAEAGQ